MEFKLQQTYPSPVIGVSNFNTITYAKHINSLILYGQQKFQSNGPAEQPKKKIAFKVDKTVAVPTTDKISIFSISERKWLVKQATGKIPSSRSDFKAVYMHPCVILYGGKSNGKTVNQVFALNCETWVWKKLFSLDGPPASEQCLFFKISEHTAGLISSNSLWLLQLVDVKWELTANQLPGSVWEKANVTLPNNIKFCWPINQELLLIVGEKKTCQINLSSKQQISEFDSCLEKLILSEQKQSIGFHCFVDPKVGLQIMEQSDYAFIATQSNIAVLKYMQKSNNKISMVSSNYQQSRLKLQRQIKCCTYVPVEQGESPSSSYLYYLDQKAQLISIKMDIVNAQPSTARKIPSEQQIIQNNSCIEEEDNEDSSVLIPSTNSRANLSKASSKNQQYAYEDGEKDENDKQYDQNEDYLIDSRLIQHQPTTKPHYPTITTSTQKQPRLTYQKMTNRDDLHNKIKHQNYEQLTQQQTNTTKQKQKPKSQQQQQTSRKNIYNMNFSQTNPVCSHNQHEKQKERENSLINDRLKHKTQQFMQEKKQITGRYRQKQRQRQRQRAGVELEDNFDNPSESIQLKHKLQNILCNQIIKRKLLESKVQALESIIKKSQKFVLMLCKYGNQSDKQKHIEKVKELRQELQWNWTKQIYYRKQMQLNKMPSIVSQQIQKTMQHIQY